VRGADPVPVVAKTENRLRTWSLPHVGHAIVVSTPPLVIERRSSNGWSQVMQRYSYVAIATTVRASQVGGNRFSGSAAGPTPRVS
jgi:hypothetical protein